jgi:hypothetical protein
VAYPKAMVRVICSRCGRKGQYRKETLLALHGPGVTLPDLRHLIVNPTRLARILQDVSF